MSKATPDMTRPASEIDNPVELYARIGYRVYLAWRSGDEPHRLYDGFNRTELRRLAELRDERS